MALVDIQPGSKASSQVVNDNFHYLQDLVGGLSLKIDGSDATVDSKIATVKNSLNDKINAVDSKLPIGSIIAWSSAIIPNGWIAMVGQSIAQYTKLKEVVGKDTLPDTRNRVLWGNNTPLNLIEAGLPNVTGQIAGLSYDNASAQQGMSGAFSWGTTTTNGAGKGEADRFGKFDASKSNAIYGKSTTVQPPAVTVVWIIKYE